MRGARPREEPGESPPGGDLLGVVLAGGESLRFGRNKALEPLAGRPMAAWGLDALAAHLPARGVVANDPEVARALGVPGRPDRVGGLGPLGGLWTALEWAREEGWAGAFLLACDLPLVGAGLVGRILGHWPSSALAVVPESPGPRGFEPLCAGYRVGCLPAVEELVRSGRRSMADLLERAEGWRIPMARLGSPGALARAFANVNTVGDARRVERLLEEGVS